MSDEVRGLLAAIEDELVALGREILLGALSPGVPGGVTRGLLASRGLRSLPELEALYEWHDGTGGSSSLKMGDLYLLPGYYFPSVEDSLENYDALSRSDRWDKSWFPILADGGGYFYVIDLASPSIGQVSHFMIDQDIHPLEHLSLRDLLRTILAGFQRHLFTVHELGYLTMDDVAFWALAAELNPDVPWWIDPL
jgi:hypothetical protein